MTTIIIINTSDFISEEMKNERKFIKNKSRGHKYLEQESKRAQIRAEQIAKLPKKMRNKLKDDCVKPSFQLKEKNTKKRSITKSDKVYSNTKRNIQDNIDDSEAALWDANYEKCDEQQEEWKALSHIDALRDSDLLWKQFDGEEIVWSEHRLSAKDFCEPELLPVSEDYYLGYPECHPVSDTEEEHDFWADFEEYECEDKYRNPHLYEDSIFYSRYKY
jgi:hypothetical protein